MKWLKFLWKSDNAFAPDFTRLEELTEELIKKDDMIRMHERLLVNICNSIKCAIWAKDTSNNFIYVNDVCCNEMLHCSYQKVVSSSPEVLMEYGLAIVCNDSDELVKSNRESMRFIEHNTKYWDTLKSPLYDGNELIGTVGTAIDITNTIPDEIKVKFTGQGLIQIPLDVILCEEKIKELMEI